MKEASNELVPVAKLFVAADKPPLREVFPDSWPLFLPVPQGLPFSGGASASPSHLFVSFFRARTA